MRGCGESGRERGDVLLHGEGEHVGLEPVDEARSPDVLGRPLPRDARPKQLVLVQDKRVRVHGRQQTPDFVRILLGAVGNTTAEPEGKKNTTIHYMAHQMPRRLGLRARTFDRNQARWRLAGQGGCCQGRPGPVRRFGGAS